MRSYCPVSNFKLKNGSIRELSKSMAAFAIPVLLAAKCFRLE
jgi:hypothetical protein